MINTEEYSASEAMKAQRDLCKEKGYPHFAPSDGRCWNCNKNIYTAVERGNYVSGINVEEAGRKLVTGCPHCNRTYCD